MQEEFFLKRKRIAGIRAEYKLCVLFTLSRTGLGYWPPYYGGVAGVLEKKTLYRRAILW